MTRRQEHARNIAIMDHGRECPYLEPVDSNVPFPATVCVLWVHEGDNWDRPHHKEYFDKALEQVAAREPIGTVYVVVPDYGNGYGVPRAVFSSPEAAQAYVDREPRDFFTDFIIETVALYDE